MADLLSLSPPTALPVPLTSFIGRDRETATELLQRPYVRLLTLRGLSDPGKTRVSLRAGDGVG